jgi:hypothetical protein
MPDEAGVQAERASRAATTTAAAGDGRFGRVITVDGKMVARRYYKQVN